MLAMTMATSLKQRTMLFFQHSLHLKRLSRRTLGAEINGLRDPYKDMAGVAVQFGCHGAPSCLLEAACQVNGGSLVAVRAQHRIAQSRYRFEKLTSECIAAFTFLIS